MKNYNYTFLIFSLFILSCTPGNEVSKTLFIYGYDFTKYSRQGFLFTPEPYDGEYESVGIIQMELYPEVTNDRDSVKKSFDSWERSGNNSWWYVGKISSEEIMDSLYKHTKRMGADAVINLQIGETEPVSNGAITYTGIEISGFAIKRK